jgi:hypothetical protein
MAAFYRQKGDEHVVDHMGDSLISVAFGIVEWLHDGWSYSFPAGHRYRRGADSTSSGAIGEVIHILLVIAIVVVLIRLLQGRRG